MRGVTDDADDKFPNSPARQLSFCISLLFLQKWKTIVGIVGKSLKSLKRSQIVTTIGNLSIVGYRRHSRHGAANVGTGVVIA
jgi:hypothetical protein